MRHHWMKEKNTTSVLGTASTGVAGVSKKQMTVGKSFFRFLVRRDTASAAFQSLISSLILRGSILMSLFFASRAPEKNGHDNDVVSLGRSVLSSARRGRSRVFRRAELISYSAVMFHSETKSSQAF